MSLSIVIPILNEGKNLEILHKKIIFNLKKIYYEIIFVDDNSDDNSKSILKKLSKNNKQTKFIIRKKNRDLTQSCFLGIENAKYDNILIMDGDLQHDPLNLPLLIQKYFKKKADVLIGTRDFKKKIEGLGIFRFFTSKILIIIFNFFFAFKTIDPLSGFFIFKKQIYTKNKKKLFGKGYKILIDLLYNNKKNIKIFDQKINFKIRNFNSSKINLRILLNFLQLIIFLKIRYK
jgi:dolichol-phosphate mannosyltransferase